jgi:hypothetical protein
MRRATLTIVVAFRCITAAAAPQPPVTFDSPCKCRDNHGEHRWSVKNDPSLPPTDASAIQSVIPSDVFNWPGPGAHLTARKLTVDQPPVIKVIGKAYFDVGHALKDQPNRRSHLPDYAAWEIHPVMKLETL